MPIAWEDDHVQSIVRKVKKVVDSNEIGPKRYIFDVYGHYEPLLQEPFSDSFDANPGEMTWRQNEDVQYLVTLNPTSQLLIWFCLAVVQAAHRRTRRHQGEFNAPQITRLLNALLFGLPSAQQALDGFH